MNSYGLIHINGVGIYYQDYGQGTPLILLHGNGENSDIFEEQVALFSRHFRVITLDSRGHGKSTHNVPELTYEAMANDVLHLLDVMNIPRCHIVGFSDGGIIALTLALHAPQRVISMIVIGANYAPSGIKPMDRMGIVWMYSYYSLLSFLIPKYRLNRRLMLLMHKYPRFKTDELSHITTPTLVVAGSNDMIRYKHTVNLAKQLPNSQLEIIPRSSHFVLNDQAEIFNKVALEFLQAHD